MFYLKFLLIFLWFLIASLGSLLLPFAIWRARDINRDFGRLLSWGILRILRIRVEVEGLHHLEAQDPVVYVVNHQSGFDLVTFGGLFPKNTIVIGKKEVAWIPVFGWIYLLGRNVLIDRKKTVQAVAGLGQVVQTIQQKRVSIWIFPEGTRNWSGKALLPFKKGAFYVAVQARVPIIPIVSSPLLRLVSWRERRLSGGVLKVRVLPPISTLNLEEDQVDQLAEATRSKMLNALESI